MWPNEWYTFGWMSQQSPKPKKKNNFRIDIYEILVCSLCLWPRLYTQSVWSVSKPSVSSGWKHLSFIDRLLRDHWENDGMVEGFVDRSLPLAIIERLVWTELKLWGDLGDGGDHWKITGRSQWSQGDHWKIIERYGLFFCQSVSQWSPALCNWG